MMKVDYKLYSSVDSPVLDEIDLLKTKDEIAMLVMLRNPSKKYAKEFTVS
jgi:hypothetical protein